MLSPLVVRTRTSRSNDSTTYVEIFLRNLYLVEFRDLELFGRPAWQNRELVQRKIVLIISSGDETVDRNYAIVAEGPHSRCRGVHDRLVT